MRYSVALKRNSDMSQHDEDPEALAESIVLSIKAALSPVLERVAGVEARLAHVAGMEKTITELRDRLVVLETRSAHPTHDVEMRERLAVLEMRTSSVVDAQRASDEDISGITDR